LRPSRGSSSVPTKSRGSGNRALLTVVQQQF
jgi:hypothetical protein